MTTAKPLNFEQVETLRRNMLLTSSQFAELLGVTRQSYYNYLNGKSTPSSGRLEKIKKTVRQCAHLVVTSGWPSGDIIGARSDYRFEVLKGELALLRNQEKQT